MSDSSFLEGGVIVSVSLLPQRHSASYGNKPRQTDIDRPNRRSLETISQTNPKHERKLNDSCPIPDTIQGDTCPQPSGAREKTVSSTAEWKRSKTGEMT
jgi:hypothetical protein